RGEMVDEMSVGCHGVVEAHPLSQAWAFKGLQPSAAIDAHADDAAVSVNFWVTPTAANRNPDHGGMVVCCVPPPPGWEVTDYHADRERVVTFLGQNAGNSLAVPYRENRAVLFKSRLFHYSDAPNFAPGYENHRISVTLLFGHHGSGRPTQRRISRPLGQYSTIPKLTHWADLPYEGGCRRCRFNDRSEKSLIRMPYEPNDQYTNSALRVGDTDTYPLRLVGEFIGIVASNEWVNKEYKHIILKVHDHALKA